MSAGRAARRISALRCLQFQPSVSVCSLGLGHRWGLPSFPGGWVETLMLAAAALWGEGCPCVLPSLAFCSDRGCFPCRPPSSCSASMTSCRDTKRKAKITARRQHPLKQPRSSGAVGPHLELLFFPPVPSWSKGSQSQLPKVWGVGWERGDGDTQCLGTGGSCWCLI